MIMINLIIINIIIIIPLIIIRINKDMNIIMNVDRWIIY